MKVVLTINLAPGEVSPEQDVMHLPCHLRGLDHETLIQSFARVSDAVSFLASNKNYVPAKASEIADWFNSAAFFAMLRAASRFQVPLAFDDITGVGLSETRYVYPDGTLVPQTLTNDAGYWIYNYRTNALRRPLARTLTECLGIVAEQRRILANLETKEEGNLDQVRRLSGPGSSKG